MEAMRLIMALVRAMLLELECHPGNDFFCPELSNLKKQRLAAEEGAGRRMRTHSDSLVPHEDQL